MKKPPYTRGFVDRHGIPRFYFRRAGYRSVALPGLPWSPEFMAAYEPLLTEKAPRVELGASLVKAGTIKALVVAYTSSAAFVSHADETRRTRRNILERFVKEHGDKRFSKLQKHHIADMLSKKLATPFAARNWLKTVRGMMQYAIEVGLLQDDPTAGVKNVKARTDGIRTWDENDIAAFEARHPLGTRERLALALGLCTGQRRGDVVKMGRQHVRLGAIKVTQHKTGTALAIPIHPDLKAALDAMPSANMTFLVTSFGKPFAAAGFGNWFRDACNAAGLPLGTSFHGLRKAACRRLAEAGCSANVIASISGHTDLREIARYTKAADQERMARSGMATLIEEAGKRTR